MDDGLLRLMRVEAGMSLSVPSTGAVVLTAGPGEADEEDDGGGEGGEVSSSGGTGRVVLESSSVSGCRVRENKRRSQQLVGEHNNGYSTDGRIYNIFSPRWDMKKSV